LRAILQQLLSALAKIASFHIELGYLGLPAGLQGGEFVGFTQQVVESDG